VYFQSQELEKNKENSQHSSHTQSQEENSVSELSLLCKQNTKESSHAI